MASDRLNSATALMDGIARGEVDRSLFSSDALWWVMGVGDMPVDVLLGHFATASAERAGPGAMRVHGVTEEGERIALEVESVNPMKDGRTYNNTYHFLVCFEGDKIRQVREYYDSAYAANFRAGNAATTP